MFKAILFDLDGTLLDIDMNDFLQHYFEAMGKMAVSYGYKDVKKMLTQVYRSTDVMIADLDPASTNEEVFMQDFLTEMDYSLNEIQGFFDDFYRLVFPELQGYCAPFEGVAEMMEKLFARPELKVVIATNAVFPASAINDRLKWAGVGHFPYELITTYEHMHFCKPHINYYEEIAQRIGVRPEECLMVGNDVGEDLVASKLGIKTFLMEDRLIDNGQYSYTPDWKGKLPDLIEFMSSLP